MYCITVFNIKYAYIVADKRRQEILETMLKALNAKYSVPMRYGKVLLCGASATGKTNFLNLLIKEDFQPLHISTEVLKPQQVTISPAAVKAVIDSNDDDSEVEFRKMNIDEEILMLESYLPENYATSTATAAPRKNPASTSKESSKACASNNDNKAIKTRANQKSSVSTAEKPSQDLSIKLALTNVNSNTKKLDKKSGKTWEILTFMDTGGQPQFISMLPAINSFAMITFIVNKLETDGEKFLNKTVDFQYGNKKGEITHKPHPHEYTYLQLTETLISYASNVLLPDTKFLEQLNVKNTNSEYTRSILLIGTHSGDNQLTEEDINHTDEKLTELVKKSHVDHIPSYFNKNYRSLVPVDSKEQSKNSNVKENAKRYTDPSRLRIYIRDFLRNQDRIDVPIKWLLLELEIRKVCQEKNCSLISYDDVLKLAKDKRLGYNGEFGDDFDGNEFIKQGLRFHHSFGVLLYFEDVEGMKKVVITNHQWLFDKLSKIVEYSFEYSFTFYTQEDFKQWENGIFKRTLLGSDCLDVRKDFENSLTDNDPINAFLNLLEYLRIAAPLNQNADKYFMPCLLSSCDLNQLQEKLPRYVANGIKPLLIQLKYDNNFSFPRGVFCFLVVELMMSKKWEIYGKAYVNSITFLNKGCSHYITLIDRIVCLEVCVEYKEDNKPHDEVRQIIDMALYHVCKKLNIDSNLCYGFSCSCPQIKEMHISYLAEDNDKHSCCSSNELTDLTDSHKIWLKTYFKVCK